jgi:hypothetical protein
MQFSIHSGLSVAGVLAVYLPALLSAEAFRGRADSPQTIGRSVNLLKSIDKRQNASSSNCKFSYPVTTLFDLTDIDNYRCYHRSVMARHHFVRRSLPEPSSGATCRYAHFCQLVG